MARNLSASTPRPVCAGQQMSLTFYAGRAGITYSVESSIDLQTWSTADVTLSAPDANNCRTATVPMTGPRRFMRLVVVRWGVFLLLAISVSGRGPWRKSSSIPSRVP